MLFGFDLWDNRNPGTLEPGVATETLEPGTLNPGRYSVSCQVL